MKYVYVLSEIQSGKLWGIYEDLTLLLNSYLNLRALNLYDLQIKKLILNTNIIHEIVDTHQTILDYCHFKSPIHHKSTTNGQDPNTTIEKKYPKAIIPQIEKVEQQYSIFLSNLKTFHQLIDDKVFTLDSSVDMVPELFRDKFEIFRDIVLLNVPDEEAFTYFHDRYDP